MPPAAVSFPALTGQGKILPRIRILQKLFYVVRFGDLARQGQDSANDHIFTVFENGAGHLMGFSAPHTRSIGQEPTAKRGQPILKTAGNDTAGFMGAAGLGDFLKTGI